MNWQYYISYIFTALKEIACVLSRPIFFKKVSVLDQKFARIVNIFAKRTNKSKAKKRSWVEEKKQHREQIKAQTLYYYCSEFS